MDPGCPRLIWPTPTTAIRIGEPAGRMSRRRGAPLAGELPASRQPVDFDRHPPQRRRPLPDDRSGLYGAANRRRPRMLRGFAISANRDDGPGSSRSDDRGRRVPCDRGHVHDLRVRESPDCRSRRPTSPPSPGAWQKRIASTLPRPRMRQSRSTIDVSCWGFSSSRVIAADVNASAALMFHRGIRARQSTRALLRQHTSSRTGINNASRSEAPSTPCAAGQ